MLKKTLGEIRKSEGELRLAYREFRLAYPSGIFTIPLDENNLTVEEVFKKYFDRPLENFVLLLGEKPVSVYYDGELVEKGKLTEEMVYRSTCFGRDRIKKIVEEYNSPK